MPQQKTLGRKLGAVLAQHLADSLREHNKKITVKGVPDRVVRGALEGIAEALQDHAMDLDATPVIVEATATPDPAK